MTQSTLPPVRPDVQAFLAMLANLPGPRTHEVEPELARQTYRAMKDVADPPLCDLGAIADLIIPGPAGDVPARLFDARGSREPGPVIVFFHGGGFVIGDLDSHASYCAELARATDLPVIAIDYRLAPEARWPAAADDCEAAARWIASNPAQSGRRATSLVLAGDSAGGNLAIVTAMALRDAPADVPVIAQLAWYPATDSSRRYASHDALGQGYLLTADTIDYFNRHYAAEAEHVRASPLLGDLTGLPPAVVVTASLDPIRDQGRAYAAALAQAGVPVVFREAVGNIHGFITLRKVIPSSVGDVAAAHVALKSLVAEAEGARVMAQAAA